MNFIFNSLVLSLTVVPSVAWQSMTQFALLFLKVIPICGSLKYNLQCYNPCLPKAYILLKLWKFHFSLEVKCGHFYFLMLCSSMITLIFL